MSSPTMIEVPVHSDKEWTARSGGSVPMRIAVPPTPKTFEELHKAEENAAVLRKLHLNSVAANAARESQRAKEAKSRRLRLEANEKARLQSRKENWVQREHRLAEEKERALLERKSKSTALAEAVQAARAARQAAVARRGESEAERCSDAANKRSKAIRATVEKNAFCVKRALAVVAATKEREAAEAAAAADELAGRLDAAASRREEEVGAIQAIARLTLRSSLVARNRSAQAAAAEERRIAKKAQMESASARRAGALLAVIERAEAATSKMAKKLQESTDADEARKAEEGRNAIFRKLAAAEVRRLTLQSGKCHKKGVEVELDASFTSAGAVAPRRLVERLASRKPPAGFGLGCLSVARVEHALGMRVVPESAVRPSFAEREEGAAVRHHVFLAARAAMGALFGRARVLGAAYNRAYVAAARRAYVAAKYERDQENVAMARALRVRSAYIMNRRVPVAATVRATEDAALKGLHRHRERCRVVAAGRRAEHLLTLTVGRQEKHALAAHRRVRAHLVRCVRANLADVRSELATAQRDHVLSAVVARAKMSGMRRSTPVKLAHNGKTFEVVS